MPFHQASGTTSGATGGMSFNRIVDAGNRCKTDETEPMLQRLSTGSYPHNSLGINFAEGGAVPRGNETELLKLELAKQVEANNRLKDMIGQLTQTINKQIN